MRGVSLLAPQDRTPPARPRATLYSDAMAVNQEYAGRTMDAVGPYAVDAALISAFARAVGATDPVHFDAEAARAAGYRDVIAPPTLAVRFDQLASRAYVEDPDAGVDYSRVVHGEQRFVHHRPITAGDEVSAQSTVDAIRSAGGHSMITVRSEITAAGEPVATTYSTIVVRGGE